MNITGGMNLSLYEVQEAADIVASASDEEVNMIFGSVINENLNDEIIVTVIATGFSDDMASGTSPSSALGGRPLGRSGQAQQPIQRTRPEPVQTEQVRQAPPQEEQLDIPTFLRNRRNRH